MTTIGDATVGDESGAGTPPTFAGLTSATAIDESSVATTWDPAVDTSTMQGSMVYRVYAGTTAGGEDFTQPLATTPAGATGALITGLRAATTYYFVARAVDSHGLEDANTAERSATTTDTTAPVFAGVQSVTGVDRDQLALTWNAAVDNSGGASTYQIFYSTTQGGENFTAPSATTAAGATQFPLTGLAEATTYFVVVRAVDASGNSDRNDKELSGTTLDKTPPIFDGATKATALGTTITVTWTAATDNVDPPSAIAYDVYMSTNLGVEDFTKPTFTTVAGATSYTAVKLDVSTTYYFVVRAMDSSKNENLNLNEVSAKTAASPDITPPVFAGLTAATGTSDTTIDLSWAAATDDYSTAANITYDIFEASSPGGEAYTPAPTYKTAPGQTSYTVTGLQPLQTQYFVVRARDQAGNEDTNTHEKSATSLPDTVPPSFGGLTSATATTPTTIELDWAAASDDVSSYTAITYNVYMGLAPGGESASPLVTTVAAATQFVATGLNPKTKYYFYVRAVDAAGNPDTSTPPVELEATTPADVTPPTFAGVTSLASTDPQTLTAGWGAANDYVTPPGGIVYRAYISTSAGGELATTPVVTAPGATTVTFTGLTPSTTYYVIVRSVDQAGNVDGNTHELSAATEADTTPPAFAGASSVGSATDSTLKVTWLAAKDAVTPAAAIKYQVCMTQTSGGCNGASFATLTTITGGLTYTATGLTPNTTYYFVVRSVDQAGNNDGNNAQASGLTAKDLVPPSFPSGTGLTASALGNASIRLAWNAATDDVSLSGQLVYDIFQSTAAGGEVFTSPTYTTAAGATSYLIPQQYPPLLQPNQAYHFVVRARDMAGNEDANSTEASATTLPDTTPPTFSGASNISPPSSLTQLTVNWSAASDDITAPSAIVYYVCWATDDSCATSFTIDATTAAAATSYLITGLSASTSYHVLVRARDAAGNVSTNTAIQVQSTLADTTAPSFNGATGCSNASATSLTVNWALATDNYSAQASLRYLVCITGVSNGCGGAGGAFTPTQTVTNVTSVAFNSLSPTTTYYFVVRAEDQAGNIDTNYNIVSGQTVVDTTPPTFAGLTSVVAAAGVLGDANLTLTWPAASDNVSSAAQIAYDIYQSTTSGGEPVTGTATYSAPAGTLSITVPLTTPGLLPSTTYYYEVRARDAAGNRSIAPYKEVSGTTTADHVAPTFTGGITGLTAFSDTQLTATWSTPATDDTTASSLIVYEVCWNVHGSASPCTSTFVAMGTTAAGASSYTNVVKALAPSTSYDVVVRAKDASGNVDTNSVSLTAKTPADTVAPTFGGATSVNGASLTTLTVNWAAATDDVTSSANMVYDICKSTSNGGCTAFSTAGGVTGATGTSYQFTGLTDHTTYYFVVRARDQAGNEETNTTQQSGLTLSDTTVPSFTAGLTSVGSATQTSLALSWGLATDNYSSQTNITFSIYESVGSGNETYGSATYSGLAQTSGSTNTFTVSSLTPNTTYCFVVRASDQAGNQETNLHEVCGTTLQILAPTFTAQPTVTSSTTSLTASWAASVTPSSTITYTVCYSTTSGACPASGTTVVPSPNTNTTYTLTGITPSNPGTTYYFVVKATDAGGTTTSSQATGTTTADTTAPTVPTNLVITTNTSYPTGINFSWTDSTDPGGSQAANIGYQLCTTSCTSSYTIAAGGGVSISSSYLGNGSSGLHGTALTSNTGYTFWIRAVDQAGNFSAWATSVAGTTAVSYATDISPILNTVSGACNGCHTGGTYTPGPYSYSFWTTAATKTAPSGGVCTAGKPFIVAGSPTTSLIYQRMDGLSVSGCSPTDQMPQGGPYVTANINTMYSWILQGAINN
jgi:hypothetical protein